MLVLISDIFSIWMTHKTCQPAYLQLWVKIGVMIASTLMQNIIWREELL